MHSQNCLYRRTLLGPNGIHITVVVVEGREATQQDENGWLLAPWVWSTSNNMQACWIYRLRGGVADDKAHKTVNSQLAVSENNRSLEIANPDIKQQVLFPVNLPAKD